MGTSQLININQDQIYESIKGLKKIKSCKIVWKPDFLINGKGTVFCYACKISMFRSKRKGWCKFMFHILLQYQIDKTVGYILYGVR